MNFIRCSGFDEDGPDFFAGAGGGLDGGLVGGDVVLAGGDVSSTTGSEFGRTSLSSIPASLRVLIILLEVASSL